MTISNEKLPSMQLSSPYSPSTNMLLPLPMPTPKAKERGTDSPRSPIKKRNVGVPKFLRFLYEILEKEDKSIISWSHKGTAFQIRKPEALSTGILPRYFKHNKVSSFQRQLNYFGFKKWTKTQTVVCTFSHPNFVHNKPENIKLIKRKERGLSEPSETYHAGHPSTSSKSSRPWFPVMPQMQSYDVFMCGADHASTINLPMETKKNSIHYHAGGATLPMPYIANQSAQYPPNHFPHEMTHATGSADTFSTEWGDVLLYAPAPIEQTTHVDNGSYFDLWEDEANQQSPSFDHVVVPNANENLTNHLLTIKHEDIQSMDTDNEEEKLSPKPTKEVAKVSNRIVLGRAWDDGPRLDEEHLVFTREDYERRKEYVKTLREFMKSKSLPGCDIFPKRKRTLRTLAEKYARCNLYFLPFVRVTLTDACWDDDLVNVSRLLFKRIPPDSRDKEGRLAISIAIQLKQGAIAKFLLDKHANINLQDDKTLHSPLHMAIIMGNKTLSRRFIEDGAQADLRDAEGMTPLHWATFRGFLEVIAMLLQYGADVNSQDNLGISALHIACFKGFTDLIDYLLHTAHANLTIEDDQGFTPALYARIQDNGEALDRIEEFIAEQKKLEEKRARRERRKAERLANQELLSSNPNSLI
ncbi:hypothetical protein THRCLA_07290 [Thraustotheca clavata]|uniref:HSF-type DNA-binding domain-containing protein n=1 Tax=Thraustotheca clavata TaxID=74557 RepID=A0A1V9ZEL0_9STRA|nr:hypothetical protein THRCLA_07290 [Thraustotheca clavata]